MIICDVTHSTVIAGQADITIRPASGEPVELHLDLSKEAIKALAERDFRRLGEIAGDSLDTTPVVEPAPKPRKQRAAKKPAASLAERAVETVEKANTEGAPQAVSDTSVDEDNIAPAQEAELSFLPDPVDDYHPYEQEDDPF